MVEHNTETPEVLSRSMGTLEVTALGVGAMIGAGIFVLTGMAAGEAGPALILAFGLNGLIAVVVGACYAELSAMMPRAGGAYVWAKPGLGSFFGFFAGWLSVFAQLVACSLYAVAFGSFACSLVSALTSLACPGWMEKTIAAGVLVCLLWINYRGAGKAGKLEVWATGLKVLILSVVVILGLRVIFGSSNGASAFTPFFPEGIGGLLSAMGITFVAFEGYEIIVQSGEEVNTPNTTIPRAIFFSIVIAVLIYLLVATVMLGAVRTPDDQPVHVYLGQLKELGLMEAAGQFVPNGKVILLIAGLASTASALNATIFGSSRIAFAMGRNGDLFSVLGRIHRSRQTPHVSIMSTGILMIVMALSLPLEDIAASTNIMFLMVFVMVCVTVIRLRHRWPDRERPFEIPFSPWLPCGGIVSGVVLSIWLLQVSRIAWAVAASWMIVGGAIHYCRRRISE